MAERVMSTGATEAIRIAQKYLPRASIKRQMELANEIAEATSLCEAELTDEITKGLEKLLART